jgi:prepilin-type N-terminal cleavage/methylation domain-containing protein
VSTKQSFTLIEIIVAISVMTIGILGVYALVPKVIGITSANTNIFIAYQLAREGIEIVRNIRDTNWLQGLAWNEGLTGCSGGCEIDYNDSSLVSYQDRYLKVDSNGFYNYETGKQTKFKRKIIITPDTDILNIKVQITWSGKGSPFEIEENLYNWR